MCSKIKADDKRVKFLLVALGMINATSLAIYLLIQILTSGSHLNANPVEPQLAVNISSSMVRKDRHHAKTGSVFRLPETTVVYLCKTKLKFGDYEFGFIFHDHKVAGVNPLAKGDSTIAGTCGDLLLDKPEELDKDGLENVTRRLLENGCIVYPRESDFVFRGMF